MHSSGSDRAHGTFHPLPNRTPPATLTASAPPADAAKWAATLALPPPPGPHSGRLKRVATWFGLLAAAAIVAVAYRAALPTLVAGQRPTLLPKANALLPFAGARRSPSGVAWDLVDVALFLDSCGTSMPADVCQCEVARLPAYYAPEVALSLADRSAGKGSALPENYRNVAIACSAG